MYVIAFAIISLGIIFSFKDFFLSDYSKKYKYQFKSDLNMYYKKIDQCFFDYELINIIQEIPGKYISVINIGTFSNILPIFSNKIPVNYYIFYADSVISDNISWQKNEINNLIKFKPNIAIISKNNCKVIQRDELILKYLNLHYKQVKFSNEFIMFRREN